MMTNLNFIYNTHYKDLNNDLKAYSTTIFNSYANTWILNKKTNVRKKKKDETFRKYYSILYMQYVIHLNKSLFEFNVVEIHFLFICECVLSRSIGNKGTKCIKYRDLQKLAYQAEQPVQ